MDCKLQAETLDTESTSKDVTPWLKFSWLYCSKHAFQANGSYIFEMVFHGPSKDAFSFQKFLEKKCWSQEIKQWFFTVTWHQGQK